MVCAITSRVSGEHGGCTTGVGSCCAWAWIPEQQGILCVHQLREGFKEERTACINRIRGLLAEFGVVLPQSLRALPPHLHDILEDASNDIAGTARIALQRALMHWQELDEHLHWCEQRITTHCKEDAQVQRAVPPSRAWGNSLHQRRSPLWATSGSLRTVHSLPPGLDWHLGKTSAGPIQVPLPNKAIVACALCWCKGPRPQR